MHFDNNADESFNNSVFSLRLHLYSSCLLVQTSVLDKNSDRDELHSVYEYNEPIQYNIRPFNNTRSFVSTLGLFEGTIIVKPYSCMLNS